MRMRSSVKGMGLAVGLLAAVLGPGAAMGQDKENPIATFVKSRLKAPDKPFTLLVGLKVKVGEEKKLEAAFARAIKATRQEKGCLAYEFNRDTADPTRYLMYERWKSLAALEAHLKTDAIKALLAELPGLTAGAPAPQVLIPAGE